jgi:LmbE family N-acetylglucosaminyl deacetylase
MLLAQDSTLHVIAFGAHPDDCDIRAAGTAIKFAAMGHKVKFVSVTNGDAGHQSEGGGALAKRRRAEAQESARRSGIAEYEVLDNHDGELLPSIAVREQIIRRIRQWQADIVLAPRPNDYHPDHRYTGVLLQDAAYMVVVPNICPDTPPLRNNPAFFYYEDHFQKPAPFRPDVAIDIDDVFLQKINVLDAHVSQFYEWLPWVDHTLESVPKDPLARKEWLTRTRIFRRSEAVLQALAKWYGPERAKQIKVSEAFELCEYGYQPKQEELKKLFPMLGK